MHWGEKRLPIICIAVQKPKARNDASSLQPNQVSTPYVSPQAPSQYNSFNVFRLSMYFAFKGWTFCGSSFADPGMEEAQRGLPRKMNNQPGGTPN